MMDDRWLTNRFLQCSFEKRTENLTRLQKAAEVMKNLIVSDERSIVLEDEYKDENNVVCVTADHGNEIVIALAASGGVSYFDSTAERTVILKADLNSALDEEEGETTYVKDVVSAASVEDDDIADYTEAYVILETREGPPNFTLVEGPIEANMGEWFKHYLDDDDRERLRQYIKEKAEEIKNLPSEIEKNYKSKFIDAYKIQEKQKRSELLNELRTEISENYETELLTSVIVSDATKSIEKDIVRSELLKTGNRIDGRDTKTVRPIKCEVGVLERTHGSALFTRGETQALVVTTLGMTDDEQRLESLEGMQRSSFMLHYNFPPFSVGECGRIGTGRREIGHGKLAWRAINSSLPLKENFPYTLRVVSEITESNGSSSMATVCGTSLSLMDAGVPIKEPVAGIAMGLIKEGDKFSVLSDILGDEDHLGDMDFKVAGTKDGITSLQMDIKITGITFEIMEKALDQAKGGREHILGEMNKALKSSRKEFSKHTPKMETIKVDKKDIATVIGKGGATIREIVETSGAKVDVKDTGEVTVAAPDEASRNKALDFLQQSQSQ